MPECRICKSNYEPFIDFGKQPIANGFLEEKNFNREYFFEMKVGHCQSCNMVQLVDQPDREMMFHEEYPFFSSLSKGMQVHFKNFADSVSKTYLSKESDPLVVEIGSNDGIMIKNFKEKNIRHLGVEPSKNVAEVARKQGINVTTEFFDLNLAKNIQKDQGKANLILSANVICHIPYIDSIFEGVAELLTEKGVFVYEDPYLGDIVEKTSYDQIYDEHVFFFSVLSVQYLSNKFGLEVINIERQPTHGGSMRYHIARKGSYQTNAAVAEQMKFEQSIGLDKPETYETLRKNIEQSRTDLVNMLKELKSGGKRVVGYGATSKSTTILNYCNIGPDLIEFVSDTTPLKQGKFTPGKHIPVKPYEDFKGDYPEYALLFAWNHKNEIMSKEQDFKNQDGKWITYVPSVHTF